MANRAAQIRQTDASRIFKAAAAAGYARARLLIHPNGVIEYIAEGEVDRKDVADPSDWAQVLE